MLKPVIDATKQVLSLSHDVQQGKADMNTVQQEIKEMRTEISDLTDAVRQLAFRVQQIEDNYARDREMLVLRLENILLKSQLMNLDN